VIARLKPDVTVAQAQAEMSAIVNALNQEYPEHRPRGARVVPELDRLVSEVRPALRIFLGAVGCVLLIVCANVANLQLARATARQKEISIRAALGASRGRLIRQVLTESILLASFGGALGLLLGLWGTETVIRLSPQDIPRLAQVSLDGHVFAFTALASLVTGTLFGLVAALHGFKPSLVEFLKEGGRGSASRRGRVRSVLVVGEVAVALMLLVAATLLTRSLLRLERVDPGFDSHHVLTFRLDSPSGYSNGQQLDFFQHVLERIRTLPGVRSASGIFGLPFSTVDIGTGFEIEGQLTAQADLPRTDYMAIEPDYFYTVGIPLKKGRDFTLRDDLKSTPVAIINETLARRFSPDQDPVGKHIKPQVSNGYDKAPMREIVGVVGDVKKGSLAADSIAQVYVPLTQSPLGLMTVVVRTEPDPQSLVAAIRTTVAQSHKDLPVYDVNTLDQYLTQSVAQPRFNTLLLSIFAGLAAVLALVGLYGVVTYSTTQRIQEIGIRIALGAERRDVLRLIVGQGLFLALIGVGIGLAGAYGLTRFLSGLLYDVHPTDPMTFGLVPLGLVGVAAFASYVPARRATKVDPIAALKYE
jgi:putative ABC transport system permease protein